MYTFGAINVVLFAYVWFFIAETKNISLEEMDIIFGDANHVVNAELSKGTAEQIEVVTADTIVMEAPKCNA